METSTSTTEIQPDITMYWSRRPGNFVDIRTGEACDYQPVFNGTPKDWYERLPLIIFSMCSELGVVAGHCQVVASPITTTLLEFGRSFNITKLPEKNGGRTEGAIGPNKDLKFLYHHDKIVPDDDEIVVIAGDKLGVIKVLDCLI